MRAPSTPALVTSETSSTAPWGGMSRKSLQANVIAPSVVNTAVAIANLDLRSVFISRVLCERRCSEAGRDADGDRAIARIRSLVDPAELIANVARGSERGGRRQGRIEPRVAADREQVLGLQVHARGRDPANQGRRQIVADLQRAQPDVRPVLDPVARELAAVRVLPI